MPQVSDAIQETLTYDKIKIKLASPDKIREWSRGEVKKPETAEFLTLLREQTERLTQMTRTLLEMSNLRHVPATWRKL